jgi:hypothetical protein
MRCARRAAGISAFLYGRVIHGLAEAARHRLFGQIKATASDLDTTCYVAE